MEQRCKFVVAHLAGRESMTELCERFGVSRRTGYKWLSRYAKAGFWGLEERSRAPHHHPHKVTDAVATVLIRARERHPRWGPRKIRALVARSHPNLKLPASSTIGELFRSTGMIKKRRRKLRSDPYAPALGGYVSPNAIWCADFKGHFAVGDERCHPLTVSDGFSRYVLACQSLRRPLSSHVRKVFEQIFRDYGLPDAIRTDNGPPFSSMSVGGLSTLSVWWIKLGIRHERIAPGRPDQNGRHERMHATLKAETASPPRRSFSAQQRAFNAFLQEFNDVRPHEALGMRTPGELYRPSSRTMPKTIQDPTYPNDAITLRTQRHGMITFERAQWYVSGCLKNELIALTPHREDQWLVHFGPVLLGKLDMNSIGRLKRSAPRIKRYRRRPF